MQQLDFQLTVPPAAEPVSLALAKSHLRVDFPDDDDIISGLISVAREMAEQKMGRAIYNQTYVLSMDQFNYGDWRSTIPVARRNPLNYSALWKSMAIYLPMPRLVSVTSVTYLDTSGTQQTLDPSAYTVVNTSQPAYIVPSQGVGTWPTSDYYIPGSVQITFVAGSYGTGLATGSVAGGYGDGGYGDGTFGDGDGTTTTGSDSCPFAIKQAILLMVGHLYTNRETTSSQNLKAIPLGFDALLSPYRFYGWM